MDKKTAVRTREKWVDNVKVIACILVVLGHFFQSMTKASILPENDLYEWFETTIYYFHVPLFFICSGYLYQKYSKVNGVSSWCKNVAKKALALGVPYVTVNTIIAAVSNIVLNFLFIPKYGYVAAAYTTLASYLISFMLHTRYAKKLEPNLYPLKRFLYPLIELLAMTILFYVFEETFAIRWAIMIIYILAMFYKERNRLKVYFPNMPFWK